MSRLPLQICTGLLALIPIATGSVTMLGVKDPLYRPPGLPEAPILDSNLRFFGGIWLGIGLAMLWLVPSIERQGTLFRALWVAVFLGGGGPSTLVDGDRAAPEALCRLHHSGASGRTTVHLLAIPAYPARGHAVIDRESWSGRRFEIHSFASHQWRRNGDDATRG